jgi:hypothetical protein
MSLPGAISAAQWAQARGGRGAGAWGGAAADPAAEARALQGALWSRQCARWHSFPQYCTRWQPLQVFFAPGEPQRAQFIERGGGKSAGASPRVSPPPPAASPPRHAITASPPSAVAASARRRLWARARHGPLAVWHCAAAEGAGPARRAAHPGGPGGRGLVGRGTSLRRNTCSGLVVPALCIFRAQTDESVSNAVGGPRTGRVTGPHSAGSSRANRQGFLSMLHSDRPWARRKRFSFFREASVSGWAAP